MVTGNGYQPNMTNWYNPTTYSAPNQQNSSSIILERITIILLVMAVTVMVAAAILNLLAVAN